MRPWLWGALLLCVWPVSEPAAPAGKSLASEASAAPNEVFARLAALLQTISDRWQSNPEQVVPFSGKSIEEVLQAASEEERQEAMQWVVRLRSTPPAERPALIEAELRRRSPTELDLWLPLRLTDTQQVTDINEAAVTLEAWLLWAATLGRQDALLVAASLAIDILRFREGPPAALPIVRTWVALPSSPNARRGQALLQSSLASILFRTGESSKALEAYRNARQLFLAVDDTRGQGNTWKNEAEVLFHLGENEKALEAQRKARQLFLELGGGSPGEGDTWVGEANILFFLGENEKALEAYRNARKVFLTIKSLLGQGNTWLGEADILLRLGENEKALGAYQEARKLFLAFGDPLGQGNAWLGEADTLLWLGEHEKALVAYQEARRLFLAIGDFLGQGNAWRGEADVQFRLGQNEKALAAYEKARQLLLVVGDALGQGNTWIGEAHVRFSLGEYKKALEGYRNARQLFSSVGSQLGQGNARLGEARSLHKDRDWRGAIEATTAAIANYKSIGAVPSQVSAFLLKADAEEKTGDMTAAAESASEAIANHAKWRKTWITDNYRTQEDETISLAYDLLVPLSARQAGRAGEALRLAEEARSRVLLDLLATGPGQGEKISAADLTTERHRLESEVWRVEEQLHRAPEAGRQVELLARRRQLDQELEWNHYRRLAADEKSFPQRAPLDVSSIQNLARQAGPILLYYTTVRETWGFLVLPGIPEIFVQPISISQTELGREIRALAHDLANPLYESRSAVRSHKLWSLLISPFAKRIPAGGPLVLVPHGPLHELPFEVLLDPAHEPLFERWQISITPSASALDFARQNHAAPSPNDYFLGFSGGRGLSLPVAEVAEIADLFNAGQAAFHSTEVNYRNYLELAPQARHLLIASRGVHTEGSRTETYLEVEPIPETHDSRLTAAEIATVPLNAELVALAACDTSHGRVLLSDERLDLTRSFLIARAAAVLSTRWKVPEDSATSRFLADFYRAYRRGGPDGKGLRKDEALTLARRRSRERGDAAQVWAAWVLVGDAR